MWKFLGAVVCGLSAVLALSLITVPIQSWPGTAPFESYLRPVAAWVPCIFLVLAAGCVLAEHRSLTGPGARALAAIGFVAAFLWPAYALAQDAAATTVNAGDLFRDFREAIEWGIGLLVAAIVGLIAAMIRRATGLSIDAKMQERLQTAAMNGVHLGLDRVQGLADGATVDVKSKILVAAIEFMRREAPAAIKHFKLADDDLEALARAKLAEVQPAGVKAARAAGA